MGCVLSKKHSKISRPKTKTGHLRHEDVDCCIRGQTSEREYQCEEPVKDLRDIICNKHPHHINFNPIEELTIDSFPEQGRTRDYLDFIYLLANLTVKISASIVSDDRPEVRLRTGGKYPHNDGKNNLVRVGTGTVVKVVPREADEGQGKCSKSYELKVITSRHVVWNETELKGTQLEISFYDLRGKNTFSTTLKADSESEYSAINMDACATRFTTYDEDLGVRLADFCYQFWEAADKLRELPSNDSSSESESGVLLAIVSHPHGCQKCVSFGEVTNSLLYLTESSTSALYVLALHLSFSLKCQSDKDMCIAYTTPTCPGCSGALIVYHCKSEDALKICTHEGFRNEDGLNHSGNPEYIKEECPSLQDKGNSGLRKRRKYSKHIDEEETKRFNDAGDLSFREEIDYAFLRSDDKKLREVLQTRYGPHIEEQVSELIREAKKFVDAAMDKDEVRLRKFEIPFIDKVLAETPTQLKKQTGWLIKQFLSDKLNRLLEKSDRFTDLEQREKTL